MGSGEGRRFSRRAFLRLAGLGAAGAVLGGAVYTRGVEPERLEVTRLTLELPRLAPEFDGYCIVQVSDLHVDSWMTPERLAESFETVNDQAADLVAVTGDFATQRVEVHPIHSALAATLGSLAAPDGVFAVLGNHDHWTVPTDLRRLLAGSGVVELPNTYHTLRRGEAQLHLAGIDDYMEGHDRLDLVLEELPEAGAAVLLAHEPDFAEISAPTGRFDLQLSGHTHGGQVRIPGAGATVLPPYGELYPMGHYRPAGMHLYTNRGLGMTAPRIRFNCRPEVTVITLRAPRKEEPDLA